MSGNFDGGGKKRGGPLVVPHPPHSIFGGIVGRAGRCRAAGRLLVVGLHHEDEVEEELVPLVLVTLDAQRMPWRGKGGPAVRGNSFDQGRNSDRRPEEAKNLTPPPHHHLKTLAPPPATPNVGAWGCGAWAKGCGLTLSQLLSSTPSIGGDALAKKTVVSPHGILFLGDTSFNRDFAMADALSGCQMEPEGEYLGLDS